MSVTAGTASILSASHVKVLFSPPTLSLSPPSTVAVHTYVTKNTPALISLVAVQKNRINSGRLVYEKITPKYQYNVMV